MTHQKLTFLEQLEAEASGNIEQKKENLYEKSTVEKLPKSLFVIIFIIFNSLLIGLFLTTSNVVQPQDQVLGLSTDQEKSESQNIGYIYEGNVVLFNNGQKKQITFDGSKSNPYKNISSINENKIGFTLCKNNSCSIYSYDLSNERIRELESINTPNINSIYFLDESDYFIDKVVDSFKFEVTRSRAKEPIYSYIGSLKQTNLDDSIGFIADDSNKFLIYYNTKLEGKDNAILIDLTTNLVSSEFKLSGKPIISGGEVVFKVEDRLVSMILTSKEQKILKNNFSGIFYSLRGSNLKYSDKSFNVFYEENLKSNSVSELRFNTVVRFESNGHYFAVKELDNGVVQNIMFDNNSRDILIQEGIIEELVVL